MKILNYIDGELVPAVSGDWLDNYEPATGEVYSHIADSDYRDVANAVLAAKSAFSSWSNFKTEERSSILQRIAKGIENKLEEFAEAESKDQGKPVWLARVMDIPRAVSNFNFFATEILHTSTATHQTDSSFLNYTLRSPLGVVGCISPWNLPLYLFTWKIAPALAAGNCVVAKPSELTPITAAMLSEICIEAGLPAGVLNIVHGLGAKVGQAIVDSEIVKAISFTGGTVTGETIARSAAPKFKKLSLELGGKNPVLVFADCDIEKAARVSARSAFLNQGEICLCGSRMYVDQSIYEKFKERFLYHVGELTVGDPKDVTSKIGALVSESHMNKVLSYIELAQQEGGSIIFGGKKVQLPGRCSNGWFVEPTVIEGLNTTCRTNQEEIFGPVVSIQPFSSEEEALEFANSTQYGLASVIWTENLQRAHTMASRIESGIVWINCWLERDLRTPFGGVKNSGVGREGGVEALRFFTEPKNVCIALQ